MTLVILGLFMVMMLATTALINRQFKEIVGQEQEEQAFQIAEAGVSYTLWLLGNGLIDFANPRGISDYAVTDHTKDPPEVLGTFDLEFTIEVHDPVNGRVALRAVSTGTDQELTDRKQVIEVVIYSDDLDIFNVVEWDHKP